MKPRVPIACLLLLAVVAMTGGAAVPSAGETAAIPSETLPAPLISVRSDPDGIPSCEELPEETVPETEPQPEIRTITLSFVGDCMLASYKGMTGSGRFNTVADQVPPSHFFEKVYDIFSADDFTVANCENVFTDRPLKERAKNGNPIYWYKSPAKNAGIFAAGSVEIVSLANNHTSDYGAAGKADTIQAVEAAGLLWGNEDRSVIVEKYGVRIGIVMCGMWGSSQVSRVVKLLKGLEGKVDYRIVYYHGGTERKYQPDEWRVTASEKMIDAGADLVIGGHPHVLQPITTYRGHEILYSLGNFLFGGAKKTDRFSMIYQKILTVSDGVILSESSRIIPVYEYEGSSTTSWQPYPMPEDSEDYRTVMAFLAGEAATPRG